LQQKQNQLLSSIGAIVVVIVTGSRLTCVTMELMPGSVSPL
jgi:hypothetical protein